MTTLDHDLDDLFAPEVIADPYPLLGHLRDNAPVHWNERYQLWVITRYDDLVWLVRHNELFSSAVIRSDQRPPYPPIDPEDAPLAAHVRDFRADQLVEQDRPEHTAMRGAVHAYFTPTAMEKWRPFVRAAVHDLLDQVVDQGEMDVLTALAAPLPVRVITRMMGVPPEDQDTLRDLADKLLYINRGESYRFKPLMEGIRGMIDYVAPRVDQRRAAPGDDFISVLAEAEGRGIFTRHQVLVNTALLLFAGHETTMNLICNGTLALLRHPDQWAAPASHPRKPPFMTRPSSRRSGSPPPTYRSAHSSSKQATASAGSLPLPTGTPRRSTSPTDSTFPGNPIHTCPSVQACTTASAPPWRAWKARRCFVRWPSACLRSGSVPERWSISRASSSARSRHFRWSGTDDGT